MLDPSPHPDLVWLRPSGAQHLVEAIREQVVRAASYRPFEGRRRVFVIEEAEALRDESQNALLKTLEEPPVFVHVILLSSEPEALLETISSRCQRIEFAALPAEAVEAALGQETGPAQAASTSGGGEVAAVARLSRGDLERARFLLGDEGGALRNAAIALAGAGRGGPAPWKALLNAAEAVGAEAETTTRAALEEAKEAGVKLSAREIGEEAKRTGRRRRADILDFGLGLCSSWCRDLEAVAVGAEGVVFNRDKFEELRDAAGEIDQGAGRRAVGLVENTRRRLVLNVSEELALEALFFRLERELS